MVDFDRLWQVSRDNPHITIESHIGGVAFIGPFGSGKTSIANLMMNRFNMRDQTAPTIAVKISHADALRMEVMFAVLQSSKATTQLCGSSAHGTTKAAGFCSLCVVWMQDQLTNVQTKAKWRSLLQAWGATKRNVVNEDYWLDQFLENAETKALAKSSYTVFWVFNDDTRYPNEYNALISRNFMFIRVDGPDEMPMQGEVNKPITNVVNFPASGALVATPNHLQHESEQFWPQFGFHARIPYENGNLASRADIAYELICEHFDAKPV